MTDGTGGGPVLLLDAASLYYRSYHALPSSMTAPDGRPHGAVRGFLATLDALVARWDASGVVACWDADWRPQWRVDLLPSYKTHRVADEPAGDTSHAVEAEPDDLGPQVDALAAILDAAGIARIGAADHEADDVVASLARTIDAATICVTGDRDLMQVASDRARVLLTVNGGMERWLLLDSDVITVDHFEIRVRVAGSFALADRVLSTLRLLLFISVPFVVLVALLLGVLSSVAQTGMVFATKSLIPDLGRLNPL